MELREYIRVVRRFLWLMIALPVIVGIGSLAVRPAAAPVYTASVRFTIGITALPMSQVTGFDPILTSFQASEYVRDDFVEVIRSDMFADDVNALLAKAGASDIKIGKGNLGAAIEKQRRLMSLSISWGNAEQAQKIADAAVKNLAENNAKYFAQLGAAGASVTVIDKPVVSRVGASLRDQLDIPIRVALAFLAAIALAFILDYLDTSIRDTRDVESLGIRVLGEIPPGK